MSVQRSDQTWIHQLKLMCRWQRLSHQCRIKNAWRKCSAGPMTDCEYLKFWLLLLLINYKNNFHLLQRIDFAMSPYCRLTDLSTYHSLRSFLCAPSPLHSIRITFDCIHVFVEAIADRFMSNTVCAPQKLYMRVDVKQWKPDIRIATSLTLVVADDRLKTHLHSDSIYRKPLTK